jgi:hypothetical protein
MLESPRKKRQKNSFGVRKFIIRRVRTFGATELNRQLPHDGIFETEQMTYKQTANHHIHNVQIFLELFNCNINCP